MSIFPAVLSFDSSRSRSLHRQLYRRSRKRPLLDQGRGQCRADYQKKDQPQHQPNKELVSAAINKLKDTRNNRNKAEKHDAAKDTEDKDQFETFSPEFDCRIRSAAAVDQVGNERGDTAHEKDEKGTYKNQNATANTDVPTALERPAAPRATGFSRVGLVVTFEAGLMIDICARGIHQPRR